MMKRTEPWEDPEVTWIETRKTRFRIIRTGKLKEGGYIVTAWDRPNGVSYRIGESESFYEAISMMFDAEEEDAL